MSTWLKLLPMVIDDIESFVDVDIEISPKDHVVGTLTDYLKKLLTLWRITQKSAEQYGIDTKYANKDNREELHAKFHELRDKAEAISNIFWIAVRDEFGLWGKESIGIRSGFTVIWSDPEPDDHLPPFLRGFFRLDE